MLPQTPNLEKDLLNSKNIRNQCENDPVYAQNLYAALCNNKFFYGDKKWTCSWRYAGGIVSELVGNGGDYMDYYCSGMSNREGFVGEGYVVDEIRYDLKIIGWEIKPYDNNNVI